MSIYHQKLSAGNAVGLRNHLIILLIVENYLVTYNKNALRT